MGPIDILTALFIAFAVVVWFAIACTAVGGIIVLALAIMDHLKSLRVQPITEKRMQ